MTTYKPVGIDSTAKFPPRVEARLAEDFVTTEVYQSTPSGDASVGTPSAADISSRLPHYGVPPQSLLLEAASTGTVIAGDNFAGSSGASLAGRNSNQGTAATWNPVSGTWQLDGSGAVAPTATTDGLIATLQLPDAYKKAFTAEVTAPWGIGSGASNNAGLIVRYVDANNFWYVTANAQLGQILLYEVKSGSHTAKAQVPSPAGTVNGTAITLRADVLDDDITVWVNGVEKFAFTSPSTGSGSRTIGIRQGMSNSYPTPIKFSNLKVSSYKGAKFNVPHFTQPSRKIIPRGAAGTFDDTDVNNANVVWDPVNLRWVIYYSGFSSTSGGTLVQGLGLAYADTLQGSWTKDSRNPIRPASNNNVENGALVWVAGRWLRATENTGANTSLFETSPDLITWTPLSTNGLTRGVHDPFMRVNYFGLLELWYGNGMPNAAIFKATSSDGGVTWNDPSNPVLGAPPLGNGTYRGNGEPSVYALPGKEGQEYIVFCDVSEVNDKAVMCCAWTTDAGATWHWRNVSGGTGSGFDSYQKFDSSPVFAEGEFHIFHSAGTQPGSGVNLDSTIGHLAEQWTPNPRSIVSHSAVAPTVLTNTTAPVISGSAVIGSVLTVTPGTWTPTPDTPTYQWYRDSTAISGKTGTTYTLVTADLGHAISVKENVTKANFLAQSATSNSITGVAAGTPGSHDPSTIPGLVTLHRADSITGVSNGAGVANWPDSSGNSYNASQGTTELQPTYVASSVNGKPGVRWSAGTQFVTTQATAGNPKQTTWAVVKPAAGALTTNSAIRGSDNVAGLEVRVSNGRLSHVSENTADLGASTTDLTATPTVIATTYDNAAGSTFRVNGAAAGSSTNVSALDPSMKMWIGINGAQIGELWQGDILELRTYSRVLTNTEIALLDSYAQDRYAISVADYS